MHSKTLIKAGLITMTLALLVSLGTSQWMTTRLFEPLNAPVSFGSGRVQTVNFEINLSEIYAVDANVDYNADDWIPGKCSLDTYFWEFRWTVYRLGSGQQKLLWADSEYFRQHDLRTDKFRASPGKYELDWKSSNDSACLNARHPRLSISTSSWDYHWIDNLTQILCSLLIGASAMLVLRGLWPALLGFLGMSQSLRIFPSLTIKNVLPLRRYRSTPMITGLPHFPLVLSSVLAILMFLFMIFRPLTPRGFRVNLHMPATAAWQRIPAAQTLGVFLDEKGRFLVNGEPVSRDGLRRKLEEELGKRIGWSVYFEAHDATRFADSVYAMDTIQSLGAKLVWITPRTREEFNRQQAESTLPFETPK